MIGRKKNTYKNTVRTIKKMRRGTYISIITLNVKGLKFQPKDTDCLDEYKNKICTCVVYKKPTLQI